MEHVVEHSHPSANTTSDRSPQAFSSLTLLTIGLLLLCLFGELIFIPDGYELALISDCLDGSSFIDCSSIHLGFRPPLMSFLAWPFGFSGIPILSILSLAGTAVIIGRICGTQTVWLSIIALFCTHRYPILADARSLLPLFLFASWGLLLSPSSTNKRAFATGILAGLTIWIRPEAQLGLLLFVPFAFILQRKYCIWIFSGVALMVVMWVLWLSILSGQFVWSPRHWEGYMLESWNFMPKRLMLQLGGMGIYNPPMRTIWMEAPLISTGVTIEFSSFLSWMKEVILQAPILWFLGVSSGVYITYRKPRLGLIFTAVLSINIISALLPQARDGAFIESNFLLTKITLISMIGMASYKIIPKYKTTSVLIPLLVLLLSPQSSIEKGREHSDIGVASIQWIQSNTDPNIHFVSSYENAPLAWRAERNWIQWNDPWHPITQKHYRITSDFDTFALGLPLCPQQKLEAHFETKGTAQRNKETEAKQWISIHSCLP